MKVLFDHQMFSRQRYGGISRYFANIYQSIQNSENIQANISVLHTKNHYIENFPGILNNWAGNVLLSKPSRNYKWNKQYSKYLVSKNNFDVFHPTYFNPYFLKHLKKPFVLTIHDMIYEALPHYFPSNDALPYHKRLLMERAEKIIAISEVTKVDILKYSNINEDKIQVIHHGIDLDNLNYQDVSNLPENYILFVGDREKYKNFHLLAEAFKAVSLKNPHIKLVLAGGGAITFGDSEFLRRHNILEKTIQISATDEQLNTIYKKAICFVYPSLYEGFGLPILEAFKNDCPVLLSNCSCFEEIARDAAQYFDGQSLPSLVSKLELIIESASTREKLVIKGREKLLAYPIDKCISKTIDVYKSI
ncbi:MAG: glycosyltransferase family 1 protein [Flavobacterium sp.]|nr:MAG: glycosyltransferase family 1 protein [Flavobacterium sp.]